jgi:hypothetical protein
MNDRAKRWAPLAGGVIVVGSVVLRMLGHGDVSATLDAIGAALGLTAVSPISGGDLAANVGALIAAGAYFYGVFRKIKAALPPPQAETPKP